jgi:hypothetical protein
MATDNRNPIGTFVETNNEYRKQINEIKSKLDEKQNINEKLELLKEYIIRYEKEYETSSIKDEKLKILGVIILNLQWYKQELECEQSRVDLGRPILSHLNPKFNNNEKWM